MLNHFTNSLEVMNSGFLKNILNLSFWIFFLTAFIAGLFYNNMTLENPIVSLYHQLCVYYLFGLQHNFGFTVNK